MDAAAAAGLSPGFRFVATDEELVAYFLLPRMRGQRLPVEGLIMEDNPRSAPPWDLFERQKWTGDEAFFFASAEGKYSKGHRQERSCAGGGTWKVQKTVDGAPLCVEPDRDVVIRWRKTMLNFHHHGDHGSTGWVMHEYTITSPADLASSPLRLYRVRFSGHGQKRKRSPHDLCDDDEDASRFAPRRRACASLGACGATPPPNPVMEGPLPFPEGWEELLATL